MYAGIDTHKDTLAVAVVDEQGRQLAGRDVANTDDGFARLSRLLDTTGWSGSGSRGRATSAAQSRCTWPCCHRARTWSVVEVPTLMTSRERRAPGRQGQDRPGRRARHRPDHRPRPEPGTGPAHRRPGRGPARPAGLPRRPARRTHRAGQPRPRRADRPGARLPAPDHQPGHPRPGPRRSSTSSPTTTSTRAELTRRRLHRVIAIDAEAADLKRQIAALVDAAGSTLTDIHGIGPVVAGRFLAEVVDARRYPTTQRLRRRQRHRTPSPPPPAEPSDTATTPAATASSTARSTRSRSPRSAATPKAAPTTDANAPKARPPAKPCAASNDESQTASTRPCSPTPRGPP